MPFHLFYIINEVAAGDAASGGWDIPKKNTVFRAKIAGFQASCGL